MEFILYLNDTKVRLLKGHSIFIYFFNKPDLCLYVACVTIGILACFPVVKKKKSLIIMEAHNLAFLFCLFFSSDKVSDG